MVEDPTCLNHSRWFESRVGVWQHRRNYSFCVSEKMVKRVHQKSERHNETHSQTHTVIQCKHQGWCWVLEEQAGGRVQISELVVVH